MPPSPAKTQAQPTETKSSPGMSCSRDLFSFYCKLGSLRPRVAVRGQQPQLVLLQQRFPRWHLQAGIGLMGEHFKLSVFYKYHLPSVQPGSKEQTVTSSRLLWGKPHPRKDLKPRHCTQPEKPQAARVSALQPPPLIVLHGVYRARAPLNAAGWGVVMPCLTFGVQFWVSTGQDRGSSDPHDLMRAQGGEEPPIRQPQHPELPAG